jgi:hypothetical protein
MADRVKADTKKPKTDDDLIAELEFAMLVDKDALDDALIQQPDLIYRVSKTIVERVSQRDAAHQDHREAEALADAEVRRDASIAEEKVTADAVKASVRVHPKVIRAADKLAELTYRVNQWGALKEAFVARGHVLRDLVSLHGNNYWSDASAGRASARRRDEDGGQAREALARNRRGGAQ